MTTATLALIIVLAILAQVIGFSLYGLYRRASSGGAVPENPATRTAGATESRASPGWEGFREFVVQRRVPEDPGGSVCSFYLAPADGRPLPPFLPGQFLTFRLPVADGETGEPRTVVRCYSLSDSPRSDCYRISVKRVPPPAGREDLPPGVASGFMHDRVEAGSRLLVKAPSGHFNLVKSDPAPVVLIAGGIGITPMLSILNTLLEAGDQREIWLFYGVRNGRELVMGEHLRSLAERHANFHLHLCFSRPDPAEVEGVDYRHGGRVDIGLLRATLKLQRYRFYVCGPAPMMETLVPALEAWGVDPGDIHYESFGPASLPPRREAQSGPAPAGTGFTVTFIRSGREVPWDPKAGSLLEFAEAQGIDVDSGCRAGSCGTCQTRLEVGEVDYAQQPDADVDAGHCLLCIATPRGDLKLDL